MIRYIGPRLGARVRWGMDGALGTSAHDESAVPDTDVPTILDKRVTNGRFENPDAIRRVGPTTGNDPQRVR